MLASLEKRELIKREMDPLNRRSIIVTLTPAGEDVLQAKDAEAAYRIDRIIACMGEQDARQFAQLIARINKAIMVSAQKNRR